MIEENSQIKELYDFKHRNDSYNNRGYNYEERFVENLTSSYLRSNPTNYNFLKQMEKYYVLSLETLLPVRNFYNFTVNKYFNKHSN